MDTSNQFYRNRLLQLLSPIDFDRLRPHLEPVALGYRDSLYETNEEIAHVYFPIEGVASLVNTMADGSATDQTVPTKTSQCGSGVLGTSNAAWNLILVPPFWDQMPFQLASRIQSPLVPWLSGEAQGSDRPLM